MSERQGTVGGWPGCDNTLARHSGSDGKTPGRSKVLACLSDYR
jgi:hypothetical protein